MWSSFVFSFRFLCVFSLVVGLSSSTSAINSCQNIVLLARNAVPTVMVKQL